MVSTTTEAKVLYTCAGCGRGIAPRSGDPVVSSNALGWGNRYHWDCAAKRYRELKRTNAQHQHDSYSRRALAAMNAAADRKARKERLAALDAAGSLFGILPDQDAAEDALECLFGEEDC